MRELINLIKSSPVTAIGYSNINEKYIDEFIDRFEEYDKVNDFNFNGDKSIVDLIEFKFNNRTHNSIVDFNIMHYSKLIRSEISRLNRNKKTILKDITYASPTNSNNMNSSIIYGSDIVIIFKEDYIDLVKCRDPHVRKKFYYSEFRDLKIDSILEK